MFFLAYENGHRALHRPLKKYLHEEAMVQTSIDSLVFDLFIPVLAGKIKLICGSVVVLNAEDAIVKPRIGCHEESEGHKLPRSDPRANTQLLLFMRGPATE